MALLIIKQCVTGLTIINNLQLSSRASYVTFFYITIFFEILDWFEDTLTMEHSRRLRRHFRPENRRDNGTKWDKGQSKILSRTTRRDVSLHLGASFYRCLSTHSLARSLVQSPPPDKCGHRANWQSIRTKSAAENIFPPLKLFALPGNKFTFVPPFRAWSPNRATSLLLFPFSTCPLWHPYSSLRELLCGQSLCLIPSRGTCSCFRLCA